MTKSGRPLKSSQRTKQASVSRLAVDAEPAFLFAVSARPAFYRVDIEIRDKEEGNRVHYAEYFRVSERKFDVRLKLNRKVFEPGQVLWARLANFGTVWVSYGYDFRIERYEGGKWVLDPSSPEGYIMPRLTLGRGAGICMRMPLCIDRPGLYRVIKEVDRGLTLGPSREVRNQFWIVPSADGVEAAERSEQCALLTQFGKV